MKNIKSKLKMFFIPCEDNHYKPKFLASGNLFYYILVLAILKIIAVSFIAYFPNTVFFADLTKTALVQLTNQERQSSGLPALKENPKLDEAALQKAQDMLQNDYFAHQSPQGLSPWYWFKNAGYTYKTAGENLAIGFLDSEEVMNSWNNSPTHKENLLNPKFKEIGIAVVKGNFQGSEATIVVQHFGAPISQAQPTVAKTVIPKNTNKTTETTTQVVQKPVTPETNIIAEETIPEQKPEPQKEAPVAVKGETTTVLQSDNFGEQQKNDSLAYKFFKFMALKYSDILQKVIFYSLLMITIALILNIFVAVKHQDKKLIFKTTVFIILLILFVISDKEVIIQIIPHSLLI